MKEKKEYSSLLNEKQYSMVEKKRGVVKSFIENNNELILTIAFMIFLFSALMNEIIDSFAGAPLWIKYISLILFIVSGVILSIYLLLGFKEYTIPLLIKVPEKIINWCKKQKKEHEILSKMPISKEELEKIGCKTRQDVFMFYRLAYYYEKDGIIYTVHHSEKIANRETEIMYQFPVNINENELNSNLYRKLFIKNETALRDKYFDDIVNDYMELKKYLSKDLIKDFDESIKKIINFI